MRPENPQSDRDYLPSRVWLVYLALFAIGIPWYWAEDDDRLVLGFPLWALVSFLSCVAIASLTAWLFLFRWPEDETEDEEERGSDKR